MTLSIKDSGSWKTVNSVYIKDAGSWKLCSDVLIKTGNVWKSVFYSAGVYDFIANSGARNDTTGAGTTYPFSFTIPTGIFQVVINAVGGGGPAVAYHDGGYGEHAWVGKPGGGISSLTIRVKPGDVISGNAGGGGGAGYYNGDDTYGIGGAGAATTIYYNGTLVCTCGAGGDYVYGALGSTTLNSGNGDNGIPWTGTAVQGVAPYTRFDTVDGYPYTYNPWGWIDYGAQPENSATVGTPAITRVDNARLGLGQHPGWVKITY